MEISKFFKEVKSEATRVTWPSRKETMMSSGMVIMMAAVAGVFFLLIDALVHKIISLILGM